MIDLIATYPLASSAISVVLSLFGAYLFMLAMKDLRAKIEADGSARCRLCDRPTEADLRAKSSVNGAVCGPLCGDCHGSLMTSEHWSDTDEAPRRGKADESDLRVERVANG